MANPKRSLPPRAVVITRKTELEQLLLRHGTLAQTRFFLESRGQALQEATHQHDVLEQALHAVLAAIPLDWRRARVPRNELDRFLFQPEDIVVAVGQDGLVANVAKYLRGQTVIGVNPSREFFDGVLVRHDPRDVLDLLKAAAAGASCEERTMVEATTDDGQRLLALNEIFVGHKSHQSARYRVCVGDRAERQSSSGVVVATGTGATGWARSIASVRSPCPALPHPTDRAAVFFVREPWPSVTTGTEVIDGRLGPDDSMRITSEMNDGGVCFGDGIEDDHLVVPFGTTLRIGVAASALHVL